MRSDEQPAERQANVEAAHHRGGRARTSEDAPVRLLRRLLGLLARSRARSRFMGGAPLQIVAEVAGEDSQRDPRPDRAAKRGLSSPTQLERTVPAGRIGLLSGRAGTACNAATRRRGKTDDIGIKTGTRTRQVWLNDQLNSR